MDDVGDPFLEVLVFHALEHAFDLAHDGLQGPFRIDLVVLDEVHRPAEEHLVIEQQQVGLQDIGLMLQIFRHAADDLPQVVLGFDDGFFESVDFVGGAVGIDKIFRNDLDPLAVHQVGFADANPR